MTKIVLIGAGSHVFTRHFVSDVLSYPKLRDSTITLMDIAKEPLDLITAFAKKLVEQHGFETQIESTTNRREALEGADYVLTTFEARGERETEADKELRGKYAIGIRESGGDSCVTPGGVFMALRHIPIILDICHDMEELCPDAWLLSYTNPVPAVTWAVNDYTHIKNVGLCHSVQGTAARLARYLDVPFDEISYWAAGINHMAWYLELKWRGKDAYPLLRERFKDPEIYSGPDATVFGPDVVRAEIFKAFGYFVSESSLQMSASVPYFKRRPDLIERFKTDLYDERKKELMGVTVHREQDEELRQQLSTGYKFPISHSGEYASIIIHSIETGIPSRINANVRNNGLITNLLEGCCVEVPALVDKEGIHPCYVGALPPQCAALNQTNINVQKLTVKAAIEKDKTSIFHALLLDPLTSATLTIDEIQRMLDEIFQLEKEYGYLEDFK
ncbi:Alpha-galactosidase [subsurface metagenome]